MLTLSLSLHLQETWCDEGPMNDVSMDGPEGPMIGVVPWMVAI